jgi:transcriptional regulator with XRE-family HTH domain
MLSSPSNTLSLLGQRIAKERLRQNLTQLALSQRSGVAYSTLRKIESKGIGAMGDYVKILATLGQVDQLAAWATSGQFALQLGPTSEITKPRKRAHSKTTKHLAEARQPNVSALTLPLISPSPVSSSRSVSSKLGKSVQLGLDFPYDWSNPAMSDKALIGAVLGRARFMDVSKVFAHFGRLKVEQVAAELGIDLHTGVIGALMLGIQRAEQHVSNP